ncbi:NADH dehydrogenase [ubiquinone] 1 alpha subcomplex subunit 2 isoform X1 [Camarhynchus parvulus]|uniref:NADH dehydrogenase [ubiquinone] 1 alpha subcomplex subunit 2 isoform X1 n=1 Tax=Geospiza parvula TaxID=87175 RepID=UPI001238267C|nr:NADH dehydrogenase [ubiquinone] 1 alpha subcomplex subunit 2 isoform X1 [Camarhynchus parvulus]
MAAVAVKSIGGRLGLALRELRIHLCQHSHSSQGVREFIEQHYVTLKKANPDFPILIRECSGIQPKLWARYGECSPEIPRNYQGMVGVGRELRDRQYLWESLGRRRASH